MKASFLAGAWAWGQLLTAYSPYWWAIGNGPLSEEAQRFWTDCLYSFWQGQNEQAGWMKEEPPVL